MVLRELKAATVDTDKESWIQVLALLGYAEALPSISATLRDANPDMMKSTITHLSHWPDPTPIEILFQVVEGDANASLRKRAVLAILQISIKAADQKQADQDTLFTWFRRASKAAQSIQERRLLIAGLRRVPCITSVQLLATYLEDPEVRSDAAYAVVNSAEPLVKGPDSQVVAAILKQMSDIQDPRLRKQIEDLEREIATMESNANP
jgi:HEAT repeat protein